jgi:hypothetical protein
MIINNLPAKHKALMEIIWEFDSVEKIVAFVETLPYKDKMAVQYLVQVAQAGGDEITDVTEAKLVLDKIAQL